MDKIYIFLSSVLGVNSVAITIIVFTVFIYLCLFPLTYQQQKFSVLQRKMQPELKAIQNKYKNKKDQASMAAQQEETQRVYDKYGVSTMGSCVQMLIQMPILLALYRVFYNVPAYITSVKGIFTNLVDGIMATDGFADKMTTLYADSGVKLTNKIDFAASNSTDVANNIIDVLYKLGENGWDALATTFPNLSDSIASTHHALSEVNYLLVLNISDTPLNLIKSAWADKYWILLILAILVPVISFLGQVINMKLMPSAPSSGNEQSDQMTNQMQSMNKFMPLMTLFFAFSVPVGLVIYWTMGSVVRIFQQYFLNKHFEKLDLDAIVEKNKEKAAKKQEKRGIRQAQIYEAAKMNTKNTMSSKANVSQDKLDALNKADEARSKAKEGSISAKANMVKKYNEKNNK
ncbi:MAG: YidC/Oxa1 family membrane protein insertase [Lachnospiraceae bacterium]|nr:YidC/Oxa1 family membrane protein insertase [Lachnospiraceae bacterium]